MTWVFLWITICFTHSGIFTAAWRIRGISEQSNNAYNPCSDPDFHCNEPPTY